MKHVFDYLYIAFTIVFTVYGQLILKWRMDMANPMPEAWGYKIIFLVKLLFDPWVFSSFFAAFLASLAWMAAMTKFELSYAYPFMSLNFVLVLVLGILFLGETASFGKVLGLFLIVLGTYVSARS